MHSTVVSEGHGNSMLNDKITKFIHYMVEYIVHKYIEYKCTVFHLGHNYCILLLKHTRRGTRVKGHRRESHVKGSDPLLSPVTGLSKYYQTSFFAHLFCMSMEFQCVVKILTGFTGNINSDTGPKEDTDNIFPLFQIFNRKKNSLSEHQ